MITGNQGELNKEKPVENIEKMKRRVGEFEIVKKLKDYSRSWAKRGTQNYEDDESGRCGYMENIYMVIV